MAGSICSQTELRIACVRSWPKTEETGTERRTERGGIPLPVLPNFFLFMPVACTANRYINKLVYLTSRIMGTANFFPLQTSQSTDETLALKKIISVIFQSLSFKFLHSINLIDQVDLKTV